MGFKPHYTKDTPREVISTDAGLHTSGGGGMPLTLLKMFTVEAREVAGWVGKVLASTRF